jgi:hypothetical protein
MKKGKPKAKPDPADAPAAIPPGTPVLLSAKQVSVAVGVAVRTLRKLRAVGRFPDPDCYVLGSEARWKVETLQRWIDAQPKEQTNARKIPGDT